MLIPGKLYRTKTHLSFVSNTSLMFDIPVDSLVLYLYKLDHCERGTMWYDLHFIVPGFSQTLKLVKYKLTVEEFMTNNFKLAET